jgi:hypothetical protein
VLTADPVLIVIKCQGDLEAAGLKAVMSKLSRTWFFDDLPGGRPDMSVGCLVGLTRPYSRPGI